MCPDEALLSAFVDEEVPSPWKERMDIHIAGCEHCSVKIDALRSLRRSLLACDDEASLNALSQAKLRIAASIDFGMTKRVSGQGFAGQLGRFWTRRVPMPIPMLAAAAAVLVFLVGMSFSVFSSLTRSSGAMASASRLISPQPASFEMLTQSLRQYSAQPIMIEMPQESLFSQLGNPIIVSSQDSGIQEVTTTSYGTAAR